MGDQACVWSRAVTVEQNLCTIKKLWIFLHDGFVPTVQLPTVHIRIDCWVPRRDLENTNPLKSHHTESITFLWWMSAFDVVSGESSRGDQDRLHTTLLSTIHFSSPVISRFQTGSFSSRLVSILQVVSECHQLNFFEFMRIQMSSFLTYPSFFRGSWTLEWWLFNVPAISRVMQCGLDLMHAFLSSPSTSEGLPDQGASLR